MVRIPEIKPEDMDGEQKRLYDKVMATTGRVNGPARGYIYSPGLWETTNAVSGHFEDCSLTHQQVRIVGMLTARYWQSEFPFAAQAGLALKAGVERAAVEAIRDGQRPTFADPKDEAVYDLVSEQLANKKISDATFEKTAELLGYPGLVDAVGAIGHFCKVAIMASAVDIAAPEAAEVKLAK